MFIDPFEFIELTDPFHDEMSSLSVKSRQLSVTLRVTLINQGVHLIGWLQLTPQHETLKQCWLMLRQRRRRWINIKTTLGQCFLFAGLSGRVLMTLVERVKNNCVYLGFHRPCILNHDIFYIWTTDHLNTVHREL